MSLLIKALHNIVLAHPAAKRKALSDSISLLQSHLKDAEDLISPQRGLHWSKRELDVEPIESGTAQGFTGTYKVVAEFFKVTEKDLCGRITSGKGQCAITTKGGYKPRVDKVTYLVKRL